MFCDGCGKKIPDASKFCPFCGAGFQQTAPAQKMNPVVNKAQAPGKRSDEITFGTASSSSYSQRHSFDDDDEFYDDDDEFWDDDSSYTPASSHQAQPRQAASTYNAQGARSSANVYGTQRASQSMNTYSTQNATRNDDARSAQHSAGAGAARSAQTARGTAQAARSNQANRGTAAGRSAQTPQIRRLS